MFPEYILVFQYFFVCFFFVLLLLFASLLLVLQGFDSEKYSPYECGFNPFEDARVKFEIHFYLVGILFIVFDLEIVFLFPWVVVFAGVSSLGLLAMLFFIIVLTLGFVYEWAGRALEWS